MASKSNKLLSQLEKLASFQLNSWNLYLVAENTVLLAFQEDKPLFTEADRPKAAQSVEKSLPLLEVAFATLHGSMNPDRRQTAQMCRSGLQFLVDEFKDNHSTYENLRWILKSSAVKCVEEYIRDSEDTPLEYSTPLQLDMTKIPKNHYWWP